MKTSPKRTPATVRLLLQAIEDQGVKAHVLAKSTGLALSTVQHLMSGDGAPSIDTVERVATALGLEIKIEKRR